MAVAVTGPLDPTPSDDGPVDPGAPAPPPTPGALGAADAPGASGASGAPGAPDTPDPPPTGPITAVVIGRAGSRGLPGKNALPLAGRPMVAWSVAHARASRHVDRVLVSTDGADIAAAARDAGAVVIERPASLATDHATVVDAVRHAIETDVANGAADPAVVVILYANVPVRPADLADRAIEHLHATLADSVQSYTDVGKHHPAWMVRLEGPGGRVAPLDPTAPDRRQDLPAYHLPDGGVIAVRRPLLGLGPHPHAFLGRDRRGIVTPPGSVVDVDDAGDLALARSILEAARGPIAERV